METRENGKQRYVDFHEVCHNLGQLERALNRSDNFPLTLKIHGCSEIMAERLVRDRFRWVNITYESAVNSPAVEKALFHKSFTQADKNAALGITSIDAHWYMDNIGGTYFSKWIKHHKPRRICFDWMSNFKVPTLQQDAPLEQQWWSHLRSLELVYPHHMGPHENAEAPIALAILKLTKHTVTELKLRHVLWPITTEQLHLPKLRKLALIEVRNWWNIVAHGVTELELSPCRSGRYENQPTGVSPPQGVTAVFPELKTLRYTATSRGMRGVLTAPKLDLLENFTGKSEGGFIWENGHQVDGRPAACLTPRKLHMHDVQVRYSILVDGLRVLDDLEEIHFYSSQLRSGFLKPWIGTPKKRAILPNLTDIFIELAPGNGMPAGQSARDSYTEMFQKLAERRNGNSTHQPQNNATVDRSIKALNSFTVKWATEMEGGTTIFASPPATDTSVSRWSTAEVSPGRNCHTLAPRQ